MTNYNQGTQITLIKADFKIIHLIMRILIIEDEFPAAQRLKQLIAECKPDAEIINVIDSVEASVLWFKTFAAPDLIFMDIQLADGLSFDIFLQTEVLAPVIFTTAFDQYSLKAFKVNSIDYLLKPIGADDLCAALEKYERYYEKKSALPERAIFEQLLQSMTQKPHYKERFLVKTGQSMIHIGIDQTAYFFSEDSMVQVQTTGVKKYFIEQTLDHLEPILNPTSFFRINRKIILKIDAIQKIHPYFNNRLKLDLLPAFKEDVIVSRERVKEFKEWVDQ